MLAIKSAQIQALFGGRQVAFCLERSDHWQAVLAHWLGPPLALHHRAVAGHWSPAEIVAVLKLAHTEAPLRAALHCPEVDEVIERNGAGTYSLLVLRILEAHLFGVEAADATFDEREPFGAAA